MKNRNFKTAGALHPILFFAVFYVVVLFLSIFICSSIFYSLNGNGISTEENLVAEKTNSPEFAVSVRPAAIVNR